MTGSRERLYCCDSLSHLDQLRPAALASLAWALVMASPLGAAALPETLVEALALARRAVERKMAQSAFAHAVYGFTLFGRSAPTIRGASTARKLCASIQAPPSPGASLE